MNWNYWKMVGKRFLKGLLSVVGSFAFLFLLQLIPELKTWAATAIKDPVYVALLTAILIALEKAMQGWRQ